MVLIQARKTRWRKWSQEIGSRHMDLFEHAGQKDQQAQAPLAERMRPTTLADFTGQEHLTGEGRFLRRAIEQDQVPSLILWGPPGTGKTTLAHLIAHSTGAAFESLSAV